MKENANIKGSLCPDGGVVIWDGKEYELNYELSNAYPFIKTKAIGGGNLYIGSEGESHYEIIKEYLKRIFPEMANMKNINAIMDGASVLGRVWIFENGNRIILSLWQYENREGVNVHNAYSDKIYYEICNNFKISPKKALYGDEKGKLFEIPLSNSNQEELSPIQQKLVGTNIPVAKYKYYRYGYVDESKKKRIKKIIRECIIEEINKILF